MIMIFQWFFHNSQIFFWFLIQWFFIVVFMLFTNVCLYMVCNGFWLIISCLTSLWFFSYNVGLLLLLIDLSTIFKNHDFFYHFHDSQCSLDLCFIVIFLLFSQLINFFQFVAYGVVFGCYSHAQCQTIFYSLYSFVFVLCFLSSHVTTTPFKRWCF